MPAPALTSAVVATVDGITGTEAFAAALVPVAVVGLVLWVFRRGRRDEVFTDITPGELPPAGTQAGRARVRRGLEWQGAVAPRFTPPDRVTPGLAGTVVDGKAHVLDVTATLLDLAVRGHLVIAVVAGAADRPPGSASGRDDHRDHDRDHRARHDWTMTRTEAATLDLMDFERTLLDKIAPPGGSARVSQLKQQGFDLTLREAQIGLYREVVARRWYLQHPLARNGGLGCLGWLMVLAALLVVFASFGHWTGPAPWLPVLTGGLGLLVAGAALARGGRGRTPRTAEGSAARVQTLGFEKYLTTAEAGQIRFEEARDLFSRYLPWAVVFGVADRWAAVFAEVAARAHVDGLADLVFDFDWIDGFDIVSQLVSGVADVVDLADVTTGADQAFADLDLTDPGDVLGFFDAVGDGLGGVVASVGDFVGSAGDLVDFGDGCLDVSGCDF